MGKRRTERQITVTEIAYRLFNYPSREGWPAVVAYLSAFIVFGALVGNVGNLLAALGQWLGPHIGLHAPTREIAQAANGLIVPGVMFAVVVGCAWLVYNRPPRPRLKFAEPTPHPGLLANLSTYNPLGNGPDFKSLEAKIDAATSPKQFRLVADTLCGTNLGPLLNAVEIHGERLRYVWLMCTKGDQGRGSSAQFETVKKLLVGLHPNLQVFEREGSPSDIQSQLEAVQRAYFHAASLGLGADDIVADITSGTAAMSVGIAIAAIDADRKLQYTRQDAAGMPVLIETSRDMLVRSGV